MSEPTTSVDIEDVLTSIRRLVSEEAHDAVLDQVSPASAADRLVLTPALRVTGTETADTSDAVPADNAAPVHEDDAAPLNSKRSFGFARPIEQKISELSAAVNRSVDDYEPEEGDVFGGVGRTPLPWAESHPNDPLSGDTDDAEDAYLNGEAINDDMLDDQPVEEVGQTAINEDMLRAMVVQIVREELQGEMGERITRNVRKLIRREINRALAIQDLA
ncbi:hypothetical protein [Donghicola sp. XS_ASV15]|uniref:hypothetical protein n=1 Tax=Donghicola sp. XS_ASV15 TaxID=3241295 RepID=UPI003511B740